ncbi:MAG: FkbM family methyltransferase [Chitinophagaceae bacterium]|nr:FkbM family methyltransferase [Chitinophagaceae bacterium]
MRTAIKKYLRQKGLYYPLRYSRLFTIYQLLFKPATIKQQQREVSFYRSFLPACQLVFDIGANDGHKTAAFLHFSEKVIACEPDAENFKQLQARFRNRKEKVVIEQVALADTPGKMPMNIHHPGSAFNTLSHKWKQLLEADNITRWDEKIHFTGTTEVTTTTLDTLISRYGVPDFIKIDTEGFEEYVLKGLSRRVPCISFETLLPDYAAELQHCILLICTLDPGAVFNIALHEKMLWPVFRPRKELEEWIAINSGGPSFEVIVKMTI